MTDVTTASRDLSLLAPRFRDAVEAAIADCRAQGFPVKVAEALRSQERQAHLYAQGRTRPGQRVTNAPTNLTSWHGYGLAVDVIHETKGWAPGKNDAETTAWFTKVGAIFKKYGCTWGGDWGSPDMPHMQWGGMPASPNVKHREMKTRFGNAAVWAYVGAGDTNAASGASIGVPVGHPAKEVGKPFLKRGSTGPAVEDLQRRLGVVGPGQPGYGTFGPKTEAAVRKFQVAHSLGNDGEVSDLTWEALG